MNTATIAAENVRLLPAIANAVDQSCLADLVDESLAAIVPPHLRLYAHLFSLSRGFGLERTEMSLEMAAVFLNMPLRAMERAYRRLIRHGWLIELAAYDAKRFGRCRTVRVLSLEIIKALNQG